MTDDESAIRNLVAEWLKATETGDDVKVLQLMADDVVFMAPGQQPMLGKQAFASAQAGMRNFVIDTGFEIKEIKISDNLAYCWNYLTVSITPKSGGNAMKRSGHVLSILEKTGDRWVVTRDANMLAINP